MHRLKTCVIIAVLCCAAPAWATWNEHSTSPAQTQTLGAVEALVEKTPKSVVVFDLDSTLFKCFGRWATIAREFGKLKGIKALAALQDKDITYSFDPSHVLIHDTQLDPELVKQILPEFQEFWTKRFFNNDYIKYDTALPGAAAFVKRLHSKGATIVYITGRDEENMRAGTVAALKRDGFPIDTDRAFLFMKQAANKGEILSDAARRKRDTESKEVVLNKVQQMGTVVASFENEPASINLYFDHFHNKGQGIAVFLDTDMAPNPNPVTLRPGIRTISGFKR